MLPVEYLIVEMFRFQEIQKAKQSDPDEVWSRQHITGSCAEGLCIPNSLLQEIGNNESEESCKMLGADLDIMLVRDASVTISDEQIPIFDIVRSKSDPRYVFLPLTEQWKKLNPAFRNTVYLHQSFLLTSGSFKKLVGLFAHKMKVEEVIIHEIIQGPASQLFIKDFKDSSMQVDTVEVFKYPNAWPESAVDWLIRPRKSGWPPPELVQSIFDSGCHLAPVGRGKRTCEPIKRKEYLTNPGYVTSKQSQEVEKTTMDEHEWRISFSVAENKLGQSLSPAQRHIFVLLKIIKKAYLSDHDVISTYHLKNIFFWECEKRENDFWREDNSAECLLSVMDHVVDCLKKRLLPHYIIPESNLLMSCDPAKLDEAAKAVLKVREDIVQKTVSFLTRLQSMMFQSREFVSSFCESKAQNKLVTEEMDVMYDYCQHFKKVIAREHKNNKENAMKSQKLTSVIDSILSVLDILDQFLSESLFSQKSLSISNPTRFSSLWSKYEDAFDNEITKVKSVCGLLDDISFILNAHLFYTLQAMFIVLNEVIDSPRASKLVNLFQNILPFFVLLVTTKISLFSVLKILASVVEKYPLKKALDSFRDYYCQARNVVKRIFCDTSPLCLRVHESLLARSYCKLWFAKNGKRSSDDREDREKFTRFVREDIKSYPYVLHLDESFIKLSLTFYDEMIKGRDSCKIVPETTVMEQVREIQQSIAHETVKACKTFYLLINELSNDDVFRCLKEITDKLLEI